MLKAQAQDSSTGLKDNGSILKLNGEDSTSRLKLQAQALGSSSMLKLNTQAQGPSSRLKITAHAQGSSSRLNNIAPAQD